MVAPLVSTIPIEARETTPRENSNHGVRSVLNGVRGDLDTAVKIFQEALEVEKSRLGANHPKITHTLHSMGLALRDRGLYEESLECLHEERRLLRERWSGDHTMEIAVVLTTIGNVYRRMGSLHEAVEHYKESLKVYENNGLEGDHPRVAVTVRIMKRTERQLESSDVRL